MPRYISSGRHSDGFHIWPSVSVANPGARSTQAEAGAPAYCGHTEPTDTHDVWNFSDDGSSIAGKWREYLYEKGPYPKSNEVERMCLECRDVFHSGRYHDPAWQRGFRAAHGIPTGEP